MCWVNALVEYARLRLVNAFGYSPLNFASLDR